MSKRKTKSNKQEEIDMKNKENEKENQKELEKMKKELKKLLDQAMHFADRLLHADKKGIKSTPAKRKSIKKSEKEMQEEGKTSVRKKGKGRKNKDFESESDDEQQDSEDDDISYLQQQPPNLIVKTLYPYQLLGLNWLISLQRTRINGILADDMGLGKTLQSVSILAYTSHFKNKDGPHIIVAPLTVLSSWMKEFNTCLPTFKVVKLLAVEEQRVEQIQQIKKDMPNVILTSYEGVQKALSDLKGIKFQYFILDEAHKVKNDEAKLTIALKQINAQHKILLTGTPLQNNLHELWSLLNFIMPNLFKDSSIFDNYMDVVNNCGFTEEEKEKLNYDFVKSLHQILAPFMLRRQKSDALDLPPKRIIHIFTGLSPLQIDLYKKVLQKKPLVQGSGMRYNNALMQLRKICCHPYIFPEVEDPSLPVLGDHIISASGKMVVLDKLLYKLKNDPVKPHQVLIFSQFKTQLDILEDFCDYKGYKFARIDGDVSLEDRDQQMHDFIQEGSDYFIFLISTRAGGLGINLYTADTVIIYDSDFNPQADLQAIDRAHRIGQKNEVMVYRLITDSTIEEKVVERQQIKLKWDQHVIQQGRIVQQKNLNSSKVTGKEADRLVMFGAEKIFKSGNSTITDEDIDQLLKRGEERTQIEEKAIQEQIQAQLEKIGDLSMNSINVFAQLSNVSEADVKAVDEAMAMTLQNVNLLGSREEQTDIQKLYNKLVRSKPTIQTFLGEYQLYQDFEELEELLQKEEVFEYYNNIVKQIEEMGEQLPVIPENIQAKMEPLNKKQMDKKNQLLKTGFPYWTDREYKKFLNAIQKYNKDQTEQIQEMVPTKTIQEVEEYTEVFFERLENDYFSDNKSLKSKIQLAQKKRDNIQKAQTCINWICEKYDDPLYEIEFDEKYYNISNQNFQYYHDQWLIFANYKYGYKNYDFILADARKRFPFEPNAWSQKREFYTNRLEKLVKYIDKQMNDQQKNAVKKVQKKQAVKNNNQQKQNNNNSKIIKSNTIIHEKQNDSSDDIENSQNKVNSNIKKDELNNKEFQKKKQTDLLSFFKQKSAQKKKAVDKNSELESQKKMYNNSK